MVRQCISTRATRLFNLDSSPERLVSPRAASHRSRRPPAYAALRNIFELRVASDRASGSTSCLAPRIVSLRVSSSLSPKLASSSVSATPSPRLVPLRRLTEALSARPTTQHLRSPPSSLRHLLSSSSPLALWSEAIHFREVHLALVQRKNLHRDSRRSSKEK